MIECKQNEAGFAVSQESGSIKNRAQKENRKAALPVVCPCDAAAPPTSRLMILISELQIWI